MPENYAPAILRWRRYAEHSDTWSSATVSMMLFGCQRWIETCSHEADEATRERIHAIKEELENWMMQCGLRIYGTMQQQFAAFMCRACDTE